VLLALRQPQRMHPPAATHASASLCMVLHLLRPTAFVCTHLCTSAPLHLPTLLSPTAFASTHADGHRHGATRTHRHQRRLCGAHWPAPRRSARQAQRRPRLAAAAAVGRRRGAATAGAGCLGNTASSASGSGHRRDFWRGRWCRFSSGQRRRIATRGRRFDICGGASIGCSAIGQAAGRHCRRRCSRHRRRRRSGEAAALQ